MAKKSSVYFGIPLMKLIRDLKEGDSVSGKINRTAERYLDLIKRHGIDLDDDERFILVNCLMESLVEPLLIRHLADEVEDSEFMQSMPEAARRLVDKLRNASYIDVLATVEKLGF